MTTLNLIKRPAQYLVIADDSDTFVNWADYVREDRLPQRLVVHVERQADHPIEREAQWNELMASVLNTGSPSLSLLTYTAVSHAHAAALARREYDICNAAVRMGEVIDTHLDHGGRGWVAIRLTDGGSNGELYGDYERARAAQKHPERCAYFAISPLFPWTPRMCEEYLAFVRDLLSGRTDYGFLIRD